MTELASVDDRTDDFCVDIRWVGAQDKPFYRATVVSESRRGSVSEEPFRGVAVIGPDELAGVIAALERHDVSLAPGKREDEGRDEYVIELSLGERDLSGSLGDGRRSPPILVDIRDALEEEHRRPLNDALSRLGGATDA